MSPRIAAALVAAVLILTGCAGGGSGSGTEQQQTRSVSMAVSDPVTLNPGRQTIAFAQTRVIFSSLMWAEPDGTVTGLNAESVTSDDAVHWTVKLRDGWTFHNGEPVTAESYVKAWNTVAYGPNAWENSGQLANIVGYDELNPEQGEPKTEELSGLKIVDELTFTVELKSPDGQFPYQVSQSQTGFFPLPEAAYADLEGFAKTPIGNGPFKIVGSYVENEPVTVEAYPEYAGPKPSVDQIVFKPYTDMTTAYTDVQAGNTDVLFVPASRMNQVKADFGDRAYVFQGLGMNYLGLPLWDDRYS